MTARPSRRAQHGLLSLLVAASYATTLLRDLFLVSQRSNKAATDTAILSMGTGAGVAAVIGIAVLLLRGAGRSTQIPALGAIGLTAIGAVTLWPNATIGLGVASGGLGLLFTVAQSVAAEKGRLAVASMSALLASLVTISVWTVHGTSTVRAIAIGYLAGALFQFCGAAIAGRSIWSAERDGTVKEPGDMGKAVILAFLGQSSWLLARFAYHGSPDGQIANASLVLGVVVSGALVIGSPTVALNLAGRTGVATTTLVKNACLAAFALVAVGLLTKPTLHLVGLPAGIEQTGLALAPHAQVLGLSLPAVTYVFLRVRRSGTPSFGRMSPWVPAIGLSLQFFLTVFGRRHSWSPPARGAGFVAGQYVTALLDRIWMSHHNDLTGPL